MGSGRGAGGSSSRFEGGISTSAGSSLGQFLPGSSLGQTSFEGGQLEGCMEESEPIGDHKRSGEGLVPKRGKMNRFLCFPINSSTYLYQYKGCKQSPLDGYGGRDSGVSGSSPKSSS